MGIKLYPHAATKTPTIGTDDTHGLDSAFGYLPSASAQTYAMATVTGPTAPLQFTSGGTLKSFVSDAIESAITISGNITINIRAKVDNAAANATVEIKILRVDSTGAILSTVVAVAPSPIPAALTTTDAAINYTVTPTSTTFAADDRIVVQIYIDDANAVNMVTGHTVTISIDAGNGSTVAGDTWVQFTENIPFKVSAVIAPTPQTPIQAVAGASAYRWPESRLPVEMRGNDGTLGRLVFWMAANPDPTGAYYNGPGPLTDIVVVRWPSA